MTTARATSPETESAAILDVEQVRREFPALHQEVNGRPLAYLDNAATAQTPRCVIDAIRYFYEVDCSNIHRGVHALSMRATETYERGRESARAFLGARETREIVFVRGTTEAVNLVASTFVRDLVGRDDEIIITAMEHHSNIVPWQLLCGRTGARLRVVPMNDDGSLDLAAYDEAFTDRTRFVSVLHVSNALGTVNPVAAMVRRAHDHGVRIMIDGAQAVPHMAVDVTSMDCDFYAFSAHKAFGPTGIGALYGKAELLDAMEPYQGGGDMITSVTFEETTYNAIPHKFEAGTPNIAGAIGMGVALDYIRNDVGLDRIAAWERELLEYATSELTKLPGVRIIGTSEEKASVLSFELEGIHPHDVGTILDQDGVAIRAGHHCAQPVMQRFGVPATARASFAFYNTKAEVDALIGGVLKVQEMFGS